MKYAISILALTLTICSPSTLACDSEFAVKVKKALQARNLDEIMQMYYLKGVDEPTRDTLERVFKRHFGDTIASVEIEAFPTDSVTAYEHNGNQYRMNASPTNQLAVHFEKQTNADGGSYKSSMKVPLGQVEGECFIITVAKVSG